MTKNNEIINSLRNNEIFNHSISIMLALDINDGSILYANETACKFYGYSLQKITNLNISDINTLPNDEIKLEIADAVNNKRNFFKFKHKLANNEIKDVEVYSNPITINEEKILISVIHDVTEKTILEKSLKKNEKKFRQLANNLQECVAIYKVNKQKEIIILDFNNAAEKLEKVKTKDIKGKKLLDIFPGAKEVGIIDAIKKVNNTGNPISLPIKWYKDNRILGWRENYIYKLDNNEIVVVYKDLTKEKQIEEKLKSSKKYYKQLFEKSKDPTLLIHNNKFIDCNAETLNILETNDKNKIINSKPSDISPKYQADETLSEDKALEMQKIAYKNGYHRFEWQHKTFKNNIVYVEVSLTSIKIENKKILYVVMRDITKRKKNEKELLKLQTAINQSFETVVITDIDGNIEYVNPAFTKTTGYTFNEVFGKNPRILSAGKISKKTYKELWDTIKSGKIWKGEFYNKRKDNTNYWEQAVISPVKNSKGQIINFIAIKYDITQQKKVEKEAEEFKNKLVILNNKYIKQNIHIKLQNKTLKEFYEENSTINKQLNSLINTSKAIIIEVDKNKIVTRWNKSAVTTIGILSKVILGNPIDNILTTLDKNNHLYDIITNAFNGKLVKNYEIELINIKGKVLNLMVSSNFKLNARKEIIGAFIIAQDITKIKDQNKILEEKVKARTKELNIALKQEKEISEMKSKFVSVVSHEFRTPLSAINFSANFIHNYYDKLTKEKIKLKLKNIETQVKHMTKLLDDILIIGRIQSNKVMFNPKIVICKKYLEPIIEEVYISKGKSHKIIYSENIKDAKMYIDELQGRNIFINLLTNAIKFSPNSNEVKIVVSATQKNVKITVVDNGIGISDKNKSKIFEPFVRAENAENIQGTGLGLSIVAEAVKKHNGKINIKSNINKGTSIEIVLPNKKSI